MQNKTIANVIGARRKVEAADDLDESFFPSLLRNFRRHALESPNAWPITDGRKKKFRLMVANSPDLRERAYRLGYRVYRKMGYIEADERAMLCSRFDAHPDTFVLLVTDETGEDVATLTLVFDTETEGLPLDDIFFLEADKLRARNRRSAEIVRLVVAEKVGGGREVLLHLFNFAYIFAKTVKQSDGFLITVNPRHAPYYVRSLGFQSSSDVKPCPKVRGAPAVLLHLDFAVAVERVVREAGLPPQAGAKSSLYPFLYSPEAEPFIAAFLANRHRPMGCEEAEHLGLLEPALPGLP